MIASPPPSPLHSDRGVIHLSKVLDFVRTGDIVLFRCRNMLSGLQRRVTRSEFDHVGVVVSHRGVRPPCRRACSCTLPGSRGTPAVRRRQRLHLLEATGDGVTCNPLRSRLKSYGNEYTEGIAIRRLVTERTLDMEAGLRRFVSSVEGKPCVALRCVGSQACATAITWSSDHRHSPLSPLPQVQAHASQAVLAREREEGQRAVGPSRRRRVVPGRR